MRSTASVLAATVLLATGLSAQSPQDTPTPPAPNGQVSQDEPRTPPGRDRSEPRPYGQVITREAKSDEGVFKVHRVRDRVYYEIPQDMFEREFLWVTQIAKTTIGAGYGGQAAGNRVVRWERRDNRVLLRSRSYQMVADKDAPIARAVEAANFDPVLMAFPIEAIGNQQSPVIDVTRLFTSDVPEFSGRTIVRGRSFDSQRAFIERAVSFPENIEVEAIHTYNNPPEAAGAPGAPPAGRGVRPGSASVLMHFSMVLLPATPMQPRLFDERVGYFSVRTIDYSRDEHRSPQRRYITRWRLEPKDPNAAISEPIKPIVYWIDPATPAKWIPYLKRGVESWQPAFEAAGFRNAIVAKDAPSPADDPEWSAEDARYSVIRWLPSTTENASGPHIHDPRSGEILETDIQFHHNVMNLVRNWYFVQVGPLDPRAATLPLPDELMGRLLEYVAAHEVGHTLGFQHNMKASSMYSAAKIRDKEWIRTMGHTPSLMDYSRFNYVAQPEDGIPVEDLVPRIGPYDIWATMWGYKRIPAATDPDAEKTTLDTWAREQDEKPYLRFATTGSNGADPGELTEAVGDENAVASTALGLKNLERVSGMLLTAAARPGEPYDDLEQLYSRMLAQWTLELNHVAAVVGGFRSQQQHWGQEGLRFTPIPRATQAEAVAFLNRHAFQTPAFAVKPEVLRRIEPNGVLQRIATSQQRVLEALLNPARIERLVEQEAIDRALAYRPTDFLRDLRRGVWSDLQPERPVRIDAYRRNLQRAYVETLAARINGRLSTANDARALFAAELRTLDGEVRTALARTTDAASRAHLQDVRAAIARALDPAVRETPPPGGPRPVAALESDVAAEIDPFNVQIDPGFCWLDPH